MNILVLGGTGFIGSHLVNALVLKGENVRVLNRGRGKKSIEVPEVEYVYADFSDSVQIAEALVDIDVVVHLISTTVPATANLNPEEDIKGNLLSTVNLMHRMRDAGVKRLVFISSGGTVYGNTEIIPIPEEHQLAPLSSYGIVKVAIENYIDMYKALYEFNTLVLRVSNPYGPRQRHLGVQGVIPTFFNKVIAGEELKIWGDGSAVRDYIYIDDLTDCLVKSIEFGLEGVYNVGAGVGASIIEVLELVEQVSGKKANKVYLPTRGFDVNKVVLDITKIKEALSWFPATSLVEGLRNYWEWLRFNGK